MKAWTIRCLAALSPLLVLPAAPAHAVYQPPPWLIVDCDEGKDGDEYTELPFLTTCDVKGGEYVATVNLRLFGEAAQDIHYVYDLLDGTAKAGQDYAPVTGGQGVIHAGEKGGYVPVQVFADGIEEAEEHFILRLRWVSGAVVIDGEARITIEANTT